MSGTKATAHQAGVLYFILMILGIVGEFFSPTFMVADDATATAANITSAVGSYRLNILVGAVSLFVFIFPVERLYTLFREVDRGRALLLVLVVTVGITLAFANLLTMLAPLVLLSGADYLSVFTKPQLEALALGFLGFHSNGALIVTAFWGLWLLPFGDLLRIKGGFYSAAGGRLAGIGHAPFRPVVMPPWIERS